MTRRTVLLITGMRGNGCREVVVRALEIIEGVTEVDVNLFRGRATVAHSAACHPSDLVRAVARAGYGATIGTSDAGTPRDGRAGESAGPEAQI